MAEKMKLKPCPFCGRKPRVNTNEEFLVIECVNLTCVNVSIEDRRDDAIRRWNTRAEEPKAESSTAATDNVNHPSHYETNGVECIVTMEAAQGADAVQDFCICNAFKYIWRHKHKNGAEDIKKAVWYLNKWLELERRYKTGNESF